MPGATAARSLLRRGLLELAPPVAELGIELPGIAAQLQEIVRGPEAGVLEHPERALAGAVLEPLLQCPQVFHVGGVAAGDRELVGLRFEHLIHRLE
jgi:hypothetical protein